MSTDATPARRPDAILCPKRYGCVGSEDRDYKFKALFGPTLGRTPAGLVYTRQILGTEQALVSLGHDPLLTSLYFPKGHPYDGQHRYDWFLAEDRGGAFTPSAPVEGLPGEDALVKLGYLKDDPYRQDEAARARVTAALAERLRSSADDPAFHADLLRRGIITRAEYDRRLAALGVDVDGSKGGDGPAPAPAPAPGPAPQAPRPDNEAKPDGEAQRGGEA
jgi:hypothetical protein